jgi:hypothetical protein
MTIIGRYVTREIARYFGIILLIVLGIYVTVDFIEKVDNFIDAGLAWQRAFLYFLYKLPFIMVQMTPVGILLAVMITFGLMAKNNELLALRIGGVSLVSLMRPIIRCVLDRDPADDSDRRRGHAAHRNPIQSNLVAGGQRAQGNPHPSERHLVEGR